MREYEVLNPSIKPKICYARKIRYKKRYVLLTKPIEEIRQAYYSKREKSYEEIAIENSDKYVRENMTCLNEVFIEDYKKTDIELEINKKSFHIIIYSKNPLSNLEVYTISVAYRDSSEYEFPVSLDWFLTFLISYYREFDEIKNFENRMSLYAYYDDYLIMFLDVVPEKIGFSSDVIRWTKYFNIIEDNGKYKTIITPYLDYEIIVYSESPISINEVKAIAQSYCQAYGYLCEGEEGPTFNDFLLYLNGTEFKKKIKKYEYHYGFLLIEI